jgi:hypothetical protein
MDTCTTNGRRGAQRAISHNKPQTWRALMGVPAQQTAGRLSGRRGIGAGAIHGICEAPLRAGLAPIECLSRPPWPVLVVNRTGP